MDFDRLEERVSERCGERAGAACDIGRVRQYIFGKRENLISDLRRFVRIPSVSAPSGGAKPFGAECRRVLDEYEKIATEHGLYSRNFDYVCAAASVGPIAPDTPKNSVGIWSHADVVPVGEGWTYPPFEGVCENGIFIGRGAQDNKCACIAGLYVLECLRELEIPLKNRYLWYVGCSEENGMADIDMYLEKYPAPKLNLVADCGFPVCVGEKTVPRHDEDSDVVKCLTSVYNRLTGEDAKPYVIGGSTYASKLPNAFAYGMILGHKDFIKNMPDGHGDFHQPDEAIDTEKLLEAAVIYTAAIAELDGILNFGGQNE